MIVAPILALVLPKTWWGKALVLLLASVFIYIDLMVIERWNTSGLSHLFDVPFLHFWVLVFFVAAIACRKYSEGKVSLLLFVSVLLVFASYDRAEQENKQKAQKAKNIAQKARKFTQNKIGITQKEAEYIIKNEEAADVAFPESCKKSGEFIRRTVENVDGILLLEVPQPDDIASDNDAEYGPYYYSFKQTLSKPNSNDFLYLLGKGKGALVEDKQIEHTGYRYVDVLDNSDGRRTVWRFYPGGGEELIRKRTTVPLPRYGISKEYIATDVKGRYGVHGSSLKVIDLKTKEVLAERIRYRRILGSYTGGYSDGIEKNEIIACPPFDSDQDGDRFQDLDFIGKVLKPGRWIPEENRKDSILKSERKYRDREENQRKAEREARREALFQRPIGGNWAQIEEMYQDLCKKSGEFIYHTAENVDGFMFKDESESTSDPSFSRFLGTYRYVDDVWNGRRYRYTASKTLPKNKILSIDPDPEPRYSVAKKDSDQKIGDYKISSYLTKISDLQTNETMAELIIYSTWSNYGPVLECPPRHDLENFVEKVLKPRP
ncbi:hypothetical protein AGMMS50256_23950 [Betaproteobacteria bacterium]|nr:hypothetical protein AGMMS50256_23950 [Betaproteobacteria bacterium]